MGPAKALLPSSRTLALSVAVTILALLLLPGLHQPQWHNFYGLPSNATSQQDLESKGTSLLAAQYETACPPQSFETHIFSTDPLIVYVENFLSQQETEYLLDLAGSYYQRSPVSKGHVLKTYDPEIRSSMSAVLPEDPVVACIERRSSAFQGYIPTSHLEPIQVVKYAVSDHFRPHFDWFEGMVNPRLSTFFVYLECRNDIGEACQGGSTQFPHFKGRFPANWCEFVDCQDDSGAGGVGFKPVVGNAVYWQNLQSNGSGHPGVWHAGMPVKSGQKVGLNIFTRRDPWTPG